MKKHILSVLIILCVLVSSSAQFGLRVSYSEVLGVPFENYLQSFNNALLVEDHVEVGIHYWARLKNKRIEFNPEIYARLPITSGEEIDYVDITGFGVQVVADIYIFDILGDCDCPTFSKEGGLLQRGFFIEILAGAEYQHAKYTEMPNELERGTTNHIVPKFGFGAGFDIGISDLMTITPLVRVQWMPGSQLPQDLIIPEENTKDTLPVFSAGIRLTFRPDYLKKRRF